VSTSPIDPVLETANPRSINELMDADPLGYSTADLDTIIHYLRKSRGEFLQAEATKTPKKKPGASMTKLDVSKALDDLLVDL